MAKKILVIDDEPHILLMVENRLTANRYEVITASSGEEGLKRSKAEKPGLILLDFVMPGMTGDEVLKRLKEDPETKDIPVLMFTADVKKVKAQAYQFRGAAGCLYKPFTPEGLLEKVRSVLGEAV